MAVEFNKSELDRMQSDAFRRVRDMQARAQQTEYGRGMQSRTMQNGAAQRTDEPQGQSGRSQSTQTRAGAAQYDSQQYPRTNGYGYAQRGQSSNGQPGHSSLPPRRSQETRSAPYNHNTPQQEYGRREASPQYRQRSGQNDQHGYEHQQANNFSEQYGRERNRDDNYGEGYAQSSGQHASNPFRQEPQNGRPIPRPQGSRNQHHALPPLPEEKRPNSILNFLNFKGLDLDGDTSLIALLILLLSSDKNDELLMLALVYIML